MELQVLVFFLIFRHLLKVNNRNIRKICVQSLNRKRNNGVFYVILLFLLLTLNKFHILSYF